LLAVCILAVAGIAASPNDGGDAGAIPDAGVVDAMDADAGAAAPPQSDDAASQGPAFVQDDGALPPVVPNIFQRLCIGTPDASSFTFAAVPPPYGDVAGCKAFDADAGFSGPRNCSCDNCFALQQQCDALEGCIAIEECALKNQCFGANACYNNPGAPCVTVINDYGSGGTASNLSALLFTCTTNSNCPRK
jgi:hypothetical protein